MYNLNTNLTSEERLNRLTRQTALNLSTHFARLKLLTNNFDATLTVDSFAELERDYLVALLYTINETLAVLHFCNGKDYIDAIFLSQLEARAWYDAAIKKVHEDVANSKSVQESMQKFEALIQELQPPPPKKEPLPDEFGDDEDEPAVVNGAAAPEARAAGVNKGLSDMASEQLSEKTAAKKKRVVN